MKKCLLMSVMSFGAMVGLMTGQIQQVLPFNNVTAEMMAAVLCFTLGVFGLAGVYAIGTSKQK
jgi:hypothetical protein